jgi:hypothetical protein
MSNILRHCERKRGSSDSPEFTSSWLFTDGSWTIILEVHSRTDHEGTEREYRYSSILSLTSALDGKWVDVTPWPLYPQERLGTHCVGDWTGTRAGLDEFDPRTVQPVAIRYTDWAIPARWTIILVINVIQCLWNTTSWVPNITRMGRLPKVCSILDKETPVNLNYKALCRVGRISVRQSEWEWQPITKDVSSAFLG